MKTKQNKYCRCASKQTPYKQNTLITKAVVMTGKKIDLNYQAHNMEIVIMHTPLMFSCVDVRYNGVKLRLQASLDEP